MALATSYRVFHGEQATQVQLEEIYKLRQRDALAAAVNDGKFSLTDENGNIILPSLWDQVVQAGETLQVVIPTEVLNPDIAANYPDIESVEAEIRPPEIPPEALPANNDSDPDEWGIPVGYEDSSDDSSGDSSSLDLESLSSESEASDRSVTGRPDREISEREPIVPTDSDGNNLVSTTKTAVIRPFDQNTTDNGKSPILRVPQQLAGNTESNSIGKANAVQIDGRTTLQLHLLPGPRTGSVMRDEQIRWVHLRSTPMDLRGFRDTCLSIAELTERQRVLVNNLLDKVEKDKLKLFVGGVFVEPGTVLRVDEDCVADPESVIFSCIPYFDLQFPSNKLSTAGQPLRSPSRSLMQSYYPYETVEERDSEQAYRKFDNEKHGALVYVPNLWMINIGSEIVVTCSNQSLQDNFGQSIKLRTIDGDFTKNGILTRDIRITDTDGRQLIFTAKECRSYFQLEQKIRESRWESQQEQTRSSQRVHRPLRRAREAEVGDLTWRASGGEMKITPRIWAGILCQRDRFFIDVKLTDGSKKGSQGGNEVVPLASGAPKPFFNWPSRPGSDDSGTNKRASEKTEAAIQCLEHVEKSVLSEVLSDYASVYGPVEKTFTSTQYYRSLPQVTAEQTKTSVEALKNNTRNTGKSGNLKCTTHETRIFQDQEAIIHKAVQLYDLKCKTFALFVTDDPDNALLRKSWASLQSIYDISTLVSGRAPHKLTPNDASSAPDADKNEQRWFIRPHFDAKDTSEPTKALKRSFERCRKCQMTTSYATSQEAFLHIKKHIKHVSGTDTPRTALEDSIVNYDQLKLELWTKGCADILSKACKIAQLLLESVQELSDGVLNEDGQMSELYTLPHSILDAFRQLIIFYFAVERAMFFTEDGFENNDIPVARPRAMTDDPFSSKQLQVLQAFGNGVRESLLAARNELCAMAKSPEPINTFDHLSLNAEEYLSTIQFQVNHRPSKRLLRSINLLQEEIAALQEVNSQQTELVLNYMSVLDDRTYKMDKPLRKAMYPYERMLLGTCQEYLRMSVQEYRYLLARCGPLSDSTKQSLEINEEDHGKAIMVFTIVTVIFLPLSFVTSFLGMNTTDIRDMGSSSTLFWTIAIPLTVLTMGSVLYIGYNGDDLRDLFETLYRNATGKQSRSVGARGISVAQRTLARKQTNSTNLSLDFSSLADEAEFADPRPEAYYRSTRLEEPQYHQRQYTIEAPTLQWEPYKAVSPNVIIYNTTRMDNSSAKPAPEEVVASIPEPVTNTAPTHRAYAQHSHTIPETYIEPATYRSSRPRPRPRLSTINEPIVLDNLSPPPPPRPVPQVRRMPEWHPDDFADYVPQRYEWVKKGHRHHRSARHVDRRGREYGRPKRRDTDEWYYRQ
ncbi:hypothetical protein E8E13_001715 [Curvularia kusanoi]|uniref:Ubiquitin-like domain-containing protein n=1 Tax=Curvularia kusanoi TaxID=90978 RepID=A0A9P4TAL3_CURKU|nr:hypothetical protein E8E13_001715 [Curvularia kusanoi]